MLFRSGFAFAAFYEVTHLSSYRAKIGARGNGFATFADALFLKRPDVVLEKCPEPALALIKLAFVAICLRYMDFAVECIMRLRAFDPTALGRHASGYATFVREFAAAYDSLTAGCNACHQAAGRAMIAIKKPDSSPYPDQDFAPQP